MREGQYVRNVEAYVISVQLHICKKKISSRLGREGQQLFFSMWGRGDMFGRVKLKKY